MSNDMIGNSIHPDSTHRIWGYEASKAWWFSQCPWQCSEKTTWTVQNYRLLYDTIRWLRIHALKQAVLFRSFSLQHHLEISYQPLLPSIIRCWTVLDRCIFSTGQDQRRKANETAKDIFDGPGLGVIGCKKTRWWFWSTPTQDASHKWRFIGIPY